RHTSSSLLDDLTVAAQNTTVTYDRDDWEHWIDADGDCQDTRAEVLIRDSSAPVTFTSSSNCTVKTGQWLDPWTTLTFFVASDVDIDHTVPLANAHRSGGWNFSATEKRNFANDLGNNDALRAMDDSTNSSKGSRGPESWKPPAKDSWCDYATDWASIKIRWGLTVNTAEYNALAQMLDTCDGATPPTTTPPATTTPVPPNPGDSKNCSDFSTYAEAKAWFDLYYPYYGDVANLDGNGDLQPCESLPGGPG
ncbi:HNH endonuclease family protein, partial [uncultured Ilumatobacter sp.]|uniref:HNH endonuclease family protein n=1 Tax=uncultured Ilumatobacter sp. TaxID=879968 RepID=UPI00374EA645